MHGSFRLLKDSPTLCVARMIKIHTSPVKAAPSVLTGSSFRNMDGVRKRPPVTPRASTAVIYRKIIVHDHLLNIELQLQQGSEEKNPAEISGNQSVLQIVTLMFSAFICIHHLLPSLGSFDLKLHEGKKRETRSRRPCLCT